MAASDPLTSRVATAIAQADKKLPLHHEPWHRRQLFSKWAGLCCYCNAPLDLDNPRSAVINHLVPLQLGGPPVDENRVLCCKKCSGSKGNRDLVAWSDLKAKASPNRQVELLCLRAAVLVRADNHLTPTRAGAPLVKVIAALDQRHAHPRFRCFAVHGIDHGFIGWTAQGGAEDALSLAATLMRFAHQAEPVSAGKVRLFRLPAAQFLDAVWVLIEHHGMVCPLSVDGVQEAPIDPGNWQHHWPFRSQAVADLRRRRFRGAPVSAPRKPRELSTRPGSVWQRERERRLAEHKRHFDYLDAKTALDLFKSNIELGELQRPCAWDMQEREIAVLRLDRSS